MSRKVMMLLSAAGVAVCLGAVSFGTQFVDIQYWGYEGTFRSRSWVGPDGSISQQTNMPKERTAIELRPAEDPPLQHASAEIVLYNLWDKDPAKWERMNWSAIVGDGGHYRFGVEHGVDGSTRPVLFAFEGEVGLPAQIPLQLVPRDATPMEVSGSTRLILDCNELPENGTGVWMVVKGELGWNLKRVEVGPENSAGEGYRVLRVAN